MTRALLTEREREILAGEATDVKDPQKYRANTRSRVRNRLERLEDDIETLEQYEPELANHLRETICEGTQNEPIHDVLTDIQDEIEELQQIHEQ